jgi:competence protein ComEA
MLPITVSVPQRRLLAALALAVIAGVLFLRHEGGGATATPWRVAPIRPQAAPRAATHSLVVDVVGAVRKPGLYHLADGARVADAVAQAGGLAPRADRRAVNLAARVADGQQVIVAARGSPGSGGASGEGAGASGAASSSGAPVSLSAASAEELDTLPGIGPVTAQKIVAFRQEHGPFTSVEGLDAIPGIGPARLAELKGLVVP